MFLKINKLFEIGMFSDMMIIIKFFNNLFLLFLLSTWLVFVSLSYVYVAFIVSTKYSLET